MRGDQLPFTWLGLAFRRKKKGEASLKRMQQTTLTSKEEQSPLREGATYL
jgi:hypothetical protein